MALPVTISGTAAAQPHGYHGPFQSSAGNFYTILLDSTDNSLIEAHKATDPTASFAEQDGANRPDAARDVACLNVFQVGDKLHVAAQLVGDGLQNQSFELVYGRFDMAADAWDIITGGSRLVTANNDLDPKNAPDRHIACDLVVRSDGDIVIVFQGAQDKIMNGFFNRVDFTVSTDGGVNWSAATEVDGAGENIYRNPRIVLGDGDTSHICYTRGNGADLMQRALSSADVLQTERDTTFDVALTASNFGLGHGISFSRSGTTKLRVFYIEAATTDPEILAFDAAADPSSFGTQNISADDPFDVSNGLAVDGSTVHFLYFKNADRDLYTSNDQDSDTWTAPAGTFTGTIAHVSCNVYARAGFFRLAHIIDDGGTVKYDEDDLGAAQQTFSVTTSLDSALQAQKSLSASLNAAVQRRDITVTTALDGALAGLVTRAANMDGAVAALTEAQASLDAAVTAALERQADLDAAVEIEQTGSASLDAAVALARAAVAGLDAVVRASKTKDAALDAALAALRTVTANLDAAVAVPQTAATLLDAAVRRSRTAQVALDAALAVVRTLAASLDAALRGRVLVVASLDAFIEGAAAPLAPGATRTFVVPGRPGHRVGSDVRTVVVPEGNRKH
ncbi:MAG: hypothetical protein ACE5KF_01100 [Kiloniellaceae bacterium]